MSFTRRKLLQGSAGAVATATLGSPARRGFGAGGSWRSAGGAQLRRPAWSLRSSAAGVEAARLVALDVSEHHARRDPRGPGLDAARRSRRLPPVHGQRRQPVRPVADRLHVDGIQERVEAGGRGRGCTRPGSGGHLIGRLVDHRRSVRRRRGRDQEARLDRDVGRGAGRPSAWRCLRRPRPAVPSSTSRPRMCRPTTRTRPCSPTASTTTWRARRR